MKIYGNIRYKTVCSLETPASTNNTGQSGCLYVEEPRYTYTYDPAQIETFNKQKTST